MDIYTSNVLKYLYYFIGDGNVSPLTKMGLIGAFKNFSILTPCVIEKKSLLIRQIMALRKDVYVIPSRKGGLFNKTERKNDKLFSTFFNRKPIRVILYL